MRMRLPRRALLSSAAATAVVVHEKPPIYPAPERETVLQETPSELEKQIGKIRRQATSAYLQGHARVQSVVDRWIGVEHAVESRVKSLSDPTEPITPGALYVGIATLTGSILARTRSLPMRLVLPPTLFVLSLRHFLPKTAHNIRAYGSELEERYAPRLAEAHATGNAHAAMTWARVVDATQDVRERTGRGVEWGVEKAQETTGLKLREALGWTERKAGELEGRAEELGGILKEKAIDAKAVMEAKAAEAKDALSGKVDESSRAVSDKLEEKKPEPPKRLV